MSASAFYDAGALKQLAINLFYGWGYNFYRTENQLRADDLMIRAKVGWLLGQARASVESAESAYRHQFLPPPTRAQPFPDASAVSGAQALERLSKTIGSLEGQIRAQPVPENDRMMQRYRQEAQALAALAACDERLVGQAETLRALLDGRAGVWIIESEPEIADGLKAISETLRNRQAVLQV
ncbi:hypothetical protein [Methylovirgula sp. 4M-Z18]|uniref:hypothetical protein n=1 Tax=Methylovirgula sp. 4M-Z18 TaxID=2293567 RepID=UPI000E2F3235|nr:hypothetical protein [Methylovirgula sp. 4M-Z18]RFB79135.1 hypothetical protein DYH55_11105 [Methylovirgula sp. 4M-Z18]